MCVADPPCCSGPPKGGPMPFTCFSQCYTEKAACSGRLLDDDAAVMCGKSHILFSLSGFCVSSDGSAQGVGEPG